jgi:hypothetical protein
MYTYHIPYTVPPLAGGLECQHFYVPVRLLVGSGAVDMARNYSGNKAASENDAASMYTVQCIPKAHTKKFIV